MKTTKILVVDDDQPLLTLMQNLLREYKYSAILANSGESAVQLARTEKPSLILLDMNMPTMSGDEVIRRIRTESELRTVPILILSGQPMTRREIESLGADGAVLKPFDLPELMRQIQSHVPVPSAT